MWGRMIRNFFLGLVIILTCMTLSGQITYGMGIIDNEYISFSPDGEAWSTNQGDRNITAYDVGTTVNTGVKSRLEELKEGQHYYTYNRGGIIPVGKWQVNLKFVNCCHTSYPNTIDGRFHGIEYERRNCFKQHYSGWNAYCADCGEIISKSWIYMTKEAAQTIHYFNLDKDYYYLCPFCNNLEQGVAFEDHECRAISFNRYKVRYNVNSAHGYSGYVPDSFHMYNNEGIYEGSEITPQSKLNRNTYKNQGYTFVGWNTEPDGNGMFFEDEAEILNLSTLEDDVVVLYAQWRKCDSKLYIDPAGGSYLGSGMPVLITGGYGTSYEIEMSRLKGPEGFTITFDSMGGESVADIHSEKIFKYWQESEPFHGILNSNTYIFAGAEDDKDILKAVYDNGSVVLPEAKKPETAFGGWYFDKDYRQYAGMPGDIITPTDNITLYALWVDFILSSEDNYSDSANGGLGAVDLDWSILNSNMCTYKIFQSMDYLTWKNVVDIYDEMGGDSTENELEKEILFNYSGTSGLYIVPQTGLYLMEAAGACGSDYGEIHGGCGGKVKIAVWLTKGEKITYSIGGNDKYNGGGSGVTYGSGGGYTVVTSDKKGKLIVAAGGGGATCISKGGDGGISNRVRADGSSDGESGAAGGGGGDVGGRCGEVSMHFHSGDTKTGGSCYEHKVVDTEEVTYKCSWKVQERTQSATHNCEVCNKMQNVTRHVFWKVHGNCGQQMQELGGYDVCNVCGTKGAKVYSWGDTNPVTSGRHNYTKTVKTTHYELTCGYDDGEIISSLPSCGGSNYVNEAEALWYECTLTDKDDIAQKDGYIRLIPKALGYIEENSLEGVAATDNAPPESVDENKVKKVGISDREIKVIWYPVEDRGTIYYHKAEAYSKDGAEYIDTSNVTENVLSTGVTGYICAYNGKKEMYFSRDDLGNADSEDYSLFFARNTYCVLPMEEKDMYLHISAVDKAGNISEPIHIQCNTADISEWPIYTEPLGIDGGENISYDDAKDLYYVRCDSKTPITLTFHSGILGNSDNQINYSIFRCIDAYNSNLLFYRGLYIPGMLNAPEEYRVPVSEISYTADGDGLLDFYSYTQIYCNDYGRKTRTVQKFVPLSQMDGKSIKIIPVAGTVLGNKVQYSDYENDKLNAITIMGDGNAPIISGREIFDNLGKFSDADDDSDYILTVNLTAADAISGVADFHVNVINTDNGCTGRYSCNEQGTINFEIEKNNRLFEGNFSLTVFAADKVGNVFSKSYCSTEFKLDAYIERFLEPHDGNFRRGDKGILTINTFGYADSVVVEFPEQFCNTIADSVISYDYSSSAEYMHSERIEFVVPLYLSEDGEYSFVIKAYKDGKELKKIPSLYAINVEGSVLDDIRTRLR